MALIVVSGALANKPGNGGAAWTRLSWLLGLKRLGHEVYFIEQIAANACSDAAGSPCDLADSVNAAFFRHVAGRFGFAATAALVCEDDLKSIGLPVTELTDVAAAADLLVNISGHLTLEALKPRLRRRVFLDLDPGYTQIWHTQRLAERQLRGHEFYFTVGENIGTPGCSVPVGDIRWRTIRQPVLLDEWPASFADGLERFTTVADWRGAFGRIEYDGAVFGVKAHEFRKFVAMPARTGERFEIALNVHAADRADAESLRRHGWTVVDPKSVACTPDRFRSYIQGAGAEFSVAQGIYVETGSGWFSDRTVRYLASGKPALVQDTGFGRTYPSGRGLVPFATVDEAVKGAQSIAADYGGHARAARAIAEQFFDSDKVLPELLQQVL
jgi:hypothetical protein